MKTIVKKILAAMVTYRLTNRPKRPKHPKLIIEHVSGNIFNNVLISEEFSNDIKEELRDLIDQGKEVPVDRLLGEYSPSKQTIIIYVKAINLFADKLMLDNKIVQMIVRLHEYAHAIFHLGSDSNHPITDHNSFLKERTDIFNSHATMVHEWIAQHLAYSGLCSEDWKSEKEAFEKMLLHQPKIYQINLPEIEGIVDSPENRPVVWSYTLNGIRTKLLDPFNPENNVQ